VERDLPFAQSLTLHQNWPNPFTAVEGTTLSFTLEKNMHSGVELSVYDVAGRRVRSLLSNALPTGTYLAEWNGRDDAGVLLPAGNYVSVLEAGGQRLSSMMVLLR
jgi:flagellar hook assembly protein FlgD